MITAVIIPYYQTREGILRRALNSVLQQKLQDDVRVDVIVVDDGSPVPARTECEGLAFVSPVNLKIIEQPNAGVGAARNAGLKNISKDTTYVAFFDSDDIWHHEYLNTAISGLEKGYDFYFCDNRRAGDKDSSFSFVDPVFSFQSFEAYLHGPSSRSLGSEFYELEKKDFLTRSLRGCPYRTPGIVYRLSVAPELKFDTSLRSAGEDSLFFLKLLFMCQHIICSSQELVAFADGVNIYSSKYNWDDSGRLVRHMDNILSLQHQKKLPLTKEDLRYLKIRINNDRKTFTFLSLRYFLKKKKLWPEELVRVIRKDLTFWLWYPFYALYVVIFYSLHLYHPMNEGNPS